MEPPGGTDLRKAPGKAQSPFSHLPGVHLAVRRLALALFRALREDKILIKTKFPSRDPRPDLRCTRSPQRGDTQSMEGCRGRWALPRCRRTPRSTAPRFFLSVRRSPGASGPAMRIRLGRLARCVTRRQYAALASRSSLLPVTGRRNKTKRNETKRNETKRNERKRKSTPKCLS